MLGLLDFAELAFLILYHELVMLSFSSFLSLFSPSKSYDLNFQSCSSFSQRKPTTSELHPLLWYFMISVTFAPYVFVSLLIFPLLFFSFFELSFLRSWYQSLFFQYLLPFYVHFLSIRSSRSCSFSESPSPPRPVPVTSGFVFGLYFFMMVVKWSLRLHVGTANSSKLSKLSPIFCHMAPLYLGPRLLSNMHLLAISLTIRMSYSLLHEVIDLRKGETEN